MWEGLKAGEKPETCPFSGALTEQPGLRQEAERTQEPVGTSGDQAVGLSGRGASFVAGDRKLGPELHIPLHSC